MYFSPFQGGVQRKGNAALGIKLLISEFFLSVSKLLIIRVGINCGVMKISADPFFDQIPP